MEGKSCRKDNKFIVREIYFDQVDAISDMIKFFQARFVFSEYEYLHIFWLFDCL